MNKMKQFLLLILFTGIFFTGKAQKIESIHIHLYTDSLKKGTHNYINVDGKLSNGNWLPLTSKEIKFSSDYGSFEGNDLVLPVHPKVAKVTVTACLKSDSAMSKQITIWIKQKEDPMLPAYNTDTERLQKRRRN